MVEIHRAFEGPTPDLPVEHPFSFDPTYGYGLEELLAVGAPEPPEDFASYWRTRYAAVVGGGPPAFELGRELDERSGARIWEIRFTSTGGVPIHGWLTRPALGEVKRLCVMGHGYGGRTAPDVPPLLPETACFQPMCRGLGASRMEGLETNRTDLHVLHGIESRETYIHGGCVEDLWLAASVLQALHPAAADSLYFVGGSFSGGLGALVMAWDPRFRAGVLRDPSFGNYPLRVQLECEGSGKHVAEYVRSHPEALEVLRYFDAASAAAFCGLPVAVIASMFDPKVPPPSQFSVFNALPGPKRLIIKTSGHYARPTASAELVAAMRMAAEFLAKHVPIHGIR